MDKRLLVKMSQFKCMNNRMKEKRIQRLAMKSNKRNQKRIAKNFRLIFGKDNYLKAISNQIQEADKI